MACKKNGRQPLLLFGHEADLLVQQCNEVPFDISTMFNADVVEYINLVGLQKSSPPLYVANTLLPVIAHLLSNSSVQVSPTWNEPILVWSVTLGIKSSGKSPVFEIIKDALQKLENEEAEKTRISYYEHRNNDETEDDPTGNRSGNVPFNPLQAQMIMNGGTFEGLQDVFKAKQDNNLPAAVLYLMDEFTLFFNHIESNPNFEDNVLSFYTAKQLIINTRRLGRLKVDQPLLQFTGFTHHDTFVRECSRKIDMGGQVERMIIVAPPKVKKDRSQEKKVERILLVPLLEVKYSLFYITNVSSIKQVLQEVHRFSFGKSNVYSFSSEASVENDFIIDTRAEELEQVEENANFVRGLGGKATSKRIRYVIFFFYSSEAFLCINYVINANICNYL